MTNAGESMPIGWELADGDELFAFIRGVSYNKGDAHDEASNGSIANLRAGNLQDEQIFLSDLVYVPDSYLRDEQRIRQGYLIIAM